MSERCYVLEILGRPYAVRYSNAPVSRDGVMGRSASSAAEIWVRADMDPFAQRQTLLHELIHAIVDDCALELTETQVSVIANALATIKQLRIDLPADCGEMQP